jgi:hypothetical protein
VVGAGIAHISATSREKELLVKQDERRAAHRVLEATLRIENRLGPTPQEYGQLHNEWQDNLWAPARRPRSEQLLVDLPRNPHGEPG